MLLLRHGETEWSKIGRHTGRTDLDLTEIGRAQAVAAREVLKDLDLNDPLVLSSPRRRALQTAELAGLTVDTVDEQLAEWDYDPGWLVWTHGCPGGESARPHTGMPDTITTEVGTAQSSVCPRP
ncbi:Possible phosphoglycerate mutase EntD [Mycobacteroides abscessus subsp. abscessus]|nr:Possible phosphoglycerate mutase EntD [Mycobacteroides abscessus subsp. abscessus]